MPKGIYPRHVKRHAVTQPLHENFKLIPLTQGQNAIVDVEDFQFLSRFNWFTTKKLYAARHNKGNPTEFMHRVILSCENGERVDHRNHDTLDNRKVNLRKSTPMENQHNSLRRRDNKSGYKGVFWRKDGQNWMAYIRTKGKLIHLGRFHSAEDAARAYDTAAKNYFGEFAHLNFPG